MLAIAYQWSGYWCECDRVGILQTLYLQLYTALLMAH